MKTERIAMEKLCNEEHFQFHSGCNDLIKKHDSQKLGIADLMKLHSKFLGQEQEVLQVINKSALSKKLVEIDMVRDDLFRGFVSGVKSYKHHFNETVRHSAYKVGIVLDKFGNIARKSFAQETAALNLLLAELQTEYKNDIAHMQMEAWLPELQKANDEFDEVMKNRYSEEAAKNKLRMRNVRSDIDGILRNICDKIDALMLVNGDKQYSVFVNEYNERVVHFKNALLTRQGRSRKNDLAVE